MRGMLDLSFAARRILVRHFGLYTEWATAFLSIAPALKTNTTPFLAVSVNGISSHRHPAWKKEETNRNGADDWKRSRLKAIVDLVEQVRE